MSDIVNSLKGNLLVILSQFLEVNTLIKRRAVEVQTVLDNMATAASESEVVRNEYKEFAFSVMGEQWSEYWQQLQADMRDLTRARVQPGKLHAALSAVFDPQPPLQQNLGVLHGRLTRLTDAALELLRPSEDSERVHQLLGEIREIASFIQANAQGEARFIFVNFREELWAAWDQGSNSVIYSQPQLICGCAWRLKLYPNGNMDGRSTHVSLFLEMTQGPDGDRKYAYSVTMCGRPRSFVRTASTNFRPGQILGWN
jgi:hypothetical protein